MNNRPSMVHIFAGDPWGHCSRCDHPVYHPIHVIDEQEALDRGLTRRTGAEYDIWGDDPAEWRRLRAQGRDA